MIVRPLHDWAVIRPSDAEEMTAGGLFIPDTAKEKPYEGIVEVIGPGAYEEEKFGKKKDKKKERRYIPTTVKPGDRVLYERYAGNTYTINGEELILVRERDILGVLPERQPRPVSAPKPLLIPAASSAPGSTALMKSSAAVAPKGAPSRGKTVKKAVKKIKKKPVSKPAKKASKKAVKKSIKKIVKVSSKTAKGRKGPIKKTGKKK